MKHEVYECTECGNAWEESHTSTCICYKPAPPAQSEPGSVWTVSEWRDIVERQADSEEFWVCFEDCMEMLAAYAQVVRERDAHAAYTEHMRKRYAPVQDRIAALERELALENQKRNEAVERASKLERDNLLVCDMASKVADERDAAKSGYTLLYDVKESLRADCDRLRAALERIAKLDGVRVNEIAREALKGTKE